MMTYIVQQTLSSYINSLDNDSLAAYINAIDGINNYTRDYLDFFKTADGLYEKGKITNEDIKEEVKAIVETKDYFILDSRDVFKKPNSTPLSVSSLPRYYIWHSGNHLIAIQSNN